jgi:ribonuclease R
VFVELDNGVEGIVPLELLPKDEYEYVEEKMALVGKKHAYRLGEQVKILVAGCDYSNLRTQFAFIDNANARQKDDKKLKFEKNK